MNNKYMDRNLLMMAVVVLLFVGCGGQNKYEKAIADFVQTDKRGTWTDLQFKMIEMGKPTNITVGDSIAILTEVFETKKAKDLEFYNQRIAEHTASMGKDRLNVLNEFYQKSIDKNQLVVDSLMKASVKIPEAYKSASANTILAQEVTCKFSIVNPLAGNARQEITEIFILNAEGDKCYRRSPMKRK